MTLLINYSKTNKKSFYDEQFANLPLKLTRIILTTTYVISIVGKLNDPIFI